MDLYWDKSYEEEQKDALRWHIKLAGSYDLPLVIHSRESLDAIIDVLNENTLPSSGGVFHCYQGDVCTARRIVDMGFMIGVGGVVTYKKTLLPEVIKDLGLAHIVLETDAPFLPPVPHRGKRNESAYIPLIAGKVAEILNTDLKKVAEVTTENAKNLFKLKF